MYSFPNNIPTFAKNKSEAVQKVAIEVFNTEMRKSKDENKARVAALAAMVNAEKEFKSRVNKQASKSVMDIIKAKYVTEE